MDFPLLSSYQKEVLFEFVKSKAHASCQSVQERLLLVLHQLLVLVNHQLQLDHFFRLQLVLHEDPVGDSAIRGDAIEAELLAGIFFCPVDLPDWVGVLGCSHRRLINGLVVSLDSDVKHHHSSIIAAYSQESWVHWMEV